MFVVLCSVLLLDWYEVNCCVIVVCTFFSLSVHFIDLRGKSSLGGLHCVVQQAMSSTHLLSSSVGYVFLTFSFLFSDDATAVLRELGITATLVVDCDCVYGLKRGVTLVVETDLGFLVGG
jgi:hypothetical protein